MLFRYSSSQLQKLQSYKVNNCYTTNSPNNYEVRSIVNKSVSLFVFSVWQTDREDKQTDKRTKIEVCRYERNATGTVC